ncbi:MAG: DsrE/DsrF/DrsH-like family protein [Planctomycetaceae bacterium]|nr:FAD-dependent oxidoreductase [Planctomycetaceae bacterium]
MSDKKRIVIVGGVAGGASAAARARRLSEDAEIILIERGQYVSFANCGLPYYLGGRIADRSRLLVATAAGLRKRFRIDVRTQTEVLRIDRPGKKVAVRTPEGAEQVIEYDALVLSPGAAPVRPPVPGFDHPRVFTLRNMADIDCIKEYVDTHKPRKAAVIGAGYIGLEMTEAFRELKVDVVLVELMDQVFGPIDPEMAAPLAEHIASHGVDLRLGTSVQRVDDDAGKPVLALSTGEKTPVDLAILAIGVRPETTLAVQAGLKIGPTGGIAVDEHMRTSDADIYAVGDVVEVTHLVGGGAALIPLAGPANRQGRIAADNIFGRDSRYRKTQGTSICKVFDLAVGMTGLSEKALKKAATPYEKVYVHPSSHAGYYPGAHTLSLKLLFDPADGRILGAQAVGAAGVDKRIDVLATALRAGMTVFDLQDLELCYAPPFGSAKDPVNYAGFVAANALKGDVALCHYADVAAPRGDQMLLDVRTPEEVRGGTIAAAANIPLDDLRERLSELPRDKEILAFCKVGLRGYLACRILKQHGFACRNLSGGYTTYKAFTRALAHDDVAPERTSASDTGAEPSGGTAFPGCDTGSKACATQAANVVKTIDACGLQCPGPIMRLRTAVDELSEGQSVSIRASDTAFAGDVPAWCASTGNRLVSLVRDTGYVVATVEKRLAAQPAPSAGGCGKGKTIVVFSDDFDKAIAAFIIANGAASMGSDVTMFFTFWGLNVLRRDGAVKVRKTLVERMFGWMMPRGAGKLKLSKMHMAGMGKAMIAGIMKKKNVLSLPELIAAARAAGVKMVACTMSMDLMGIKQEELIDGVAAGGVAMYLQTAEQGGVNLFI